MVKCDNIMITEILHIICSKWYFFLIKKNQNIKHTVILKLYTHDIWYKNQIGGPFCL